MLRLLRFDLARPAETTANPNETLSRLGRLGAQVKSEDLMLKEGITQEPRSFSKRFGLHNMR